MYCCACPEKHTVHFNGEALGLYVWTRSVIVTQAACQLLLRCEQGTRSACNALIKAKNAVRQFYSPSAKPLSSETWRRASLGFFKLCGRSILECCSICGPHPEVLLCDGIAGLCRRRATEGGARWVQRGANATVYGAESRCQGVECCEADGARGELLCCGLGWGWLKAALGAPTGAACIDRALQPASSRRPRSRSQAEQRGVRRIAGELTPISQRVPELTQ
jgi:hypothetical protein